MQDVPISSHVRDLAGICKSINSKMFPSEPLQCSERRSAWYRVYRIDVVHKHC